VVELLEQELPASQNKVEPLYLDVVFSLQLVFQRFQGHFEEKVLSMMQENITLLNRLESLKIQVTEEVASRI
jgi:hypothetical protein